MKKFVLFAMIAVLVAGAAFAGTDFNLTQDQSQSYNPIHPKRLSAGTTATLNNDAYTFSTLTSAVTLTLPPILGTSGIYGQVYVISKDTSTWPVNVVASTSDSVANTIEGAASRYLFVPSGQLVIKLNTGTDWKVVWETMPVKMNMATKTTTIYGTTGVLDTSGTNTIGTLSATAVNTATMTATGLVTGGSASIWTVGVGGTLTAATVAGTTYTGITQAQVTGLTTAATPTFAGVISTGTVTAANGVFTSGTTTTACTGAAVKTITVVGGIVTAVTCTP